MQWWNQGFCGAMRNYTFEYLNSINLKHCSQTSSNDHLCKTTNAESAQANSPTIVTVEDDHLPNGSSNHFFWPPNEKSLSKTTTTKLYPAKECKKNHKEQCIKNNDCIYFIANLSRKVCLMFIKAGQFIKSYKIM